MIRSQKKKKKNHSPMPCENNLFVFFFDSLIKDGRLGNPMRESFEGNIAY